MNEKHFIEKIKRPAPVDHTIISDIDHSHRVHEDAVTC